MRIHVNNYEPDKPMRIIALLSFHTDGSDVPTFNHSFELVGAGTFSLVDWPVGVQLVILFYFRFLIMSPEPQANHASFYSIHVPMVLSPSAYVHPTVNHLKELLLQQRLANQNKILCGASMDRGTKVYSRHLGHMSKMAATPIYHQVNNLQKSSTP